MNRKEIFAGVAESIANVLNIDSSSIREEQKLVDSLGADSLDLLDLTFHLQQKFKITISPRDLEKRTQKKLGEKLLEIDGVYTAEALEELRKAMPEIPVEELSEGLTVAQLQRRFRVATMVNLVSLLLEEKNE
jgi:acyl carrier protein